MEMGNEGGEEKWVKHYSSNHRILLVGEGDFSFSSCLARTFRSASDIVATSLDTYDVLVGMYKKAKQNLEMLVRLGASTLHGVDATKMKLRPDLSMQKFDRIIFNFPHAGFHRREDDNRLIEMHRKLVLGFFKNARGMLRPYGEIHVSHKTSHPFNRWNINELAFKNSLLLVECVDFKIEDYPGYNNKRGHKKRCDEPFPLGECSTFKFRFVPAINASEAPLHLDNTRIRSELSRGQVYYGLLGQAVTCLLQNMNVVLPEPLVYQFCRDLIGISEFFQTPLESILQYLFYWAVLFGYQRPMAEGFGRSQQCQANSNVYQYHQHPSAPSCDQRNVANGGVSFCFTGE